MSNKRRELELKLRRLNNQPRPTITLTEKKENKSLNILEKLKKINFFTFK